MSFIPVYPQSTYQPVYHNAASSISIIYPNEKKVMALENNVLKVVTNEKGEAVGDVLTIIC